MWGALFAYLRRQIGLRGDTASATGSMMARMNQLHNDLLAGFVPGGMEASANLKYSDDTEKTYTVVSGGTYYKKRGLRIFRNGTVRVAFDVVRVDSYAFTAKIHIDGVAVGTERSVGADYATFSEDITVAANSTIDIYVKNDSGSPGDMKIKNFRLYFDVTTTEAIGAGKIY